ncbi:MAG: hypothetical protein CR984_06315 [Proteobacteria bacterium]|nr:MAG: hypothetical protein CR984_06315 [Pseudomonadota bacterium]
MNFIAPNGLIFTCNAMLTSHKFPVNHSKSKKIVSEFLSRNRQIGSRSRLSNIFTAGIWLILARIKCSYNADIGQIGHLWMGSNEQGRAL